MIICAGVQLYFFAKLIIIGSLVRPGLFFLYGELKSARRIAAAVVAARSSAPIETTERLLEVVRPYINRKQEKKELAQKLIQSLIEVLSTTK